MKKIIIMVLSIDIPPYNIMIENIKKTWGLDSDIKIIYYYGNSNVVKMVDSNLYVPVLDNFSNILRKTLMSFKYVDENYDYDYIFRCCTGSYVDVKNLKKYLEDKPMSGYYSGHLGEYDNVKYCSGSGFTLSRDLVKLLYSTHSGYQGICDDVAIGKFMKNNCGIIAKHAPRFDGPFDDNTYDESHFHYHFRNDLNALYFVHNKKDVKNDN